MKKNNIVGTRIKTRREELKMTQTALAEATGYTGKTAISKIENGINDLTQSKIISFAHALRTTPAYLMGWVDDANLYKEDIFDKDKLELMQKYRSSLIAVLATMKREEDLPEALKIAMAYDEAPQHIKDAIKAMLQIKEE